MLLQAQQATQLQEHGTQRENVDLQRIAEVDEHEGFGILPAHNVQARCSHLQLRQGHESWTAGLSRSQARTHHAHVHPWVWLLDLL